jgi:DNA polymerase-3 subunit delta
MIDDFVLSQETDLNMNILDGEKLKMDQFTSSVSAMPFLGNRRLVVCNNLLKNTDKTLKKAIVDYLRNIPDYTDIIFADIDPDKRESEFKTLSKLPLAKAFLAPTDNETRKFIAEILKGTEISIDGQALYKLSFNIGGDFWRLSNELEKMIAYVRSKGKTEITEEVVDNNIEIANPHKIFDLTDAISAKDAGKALRVLNLFRKFGEDDGKIFNLIVFNFRNLVVIQDSAGQSPDTIAKETGIHPFVVKKTISSLRNFSPKTLVKIYRQLHEIDWQVKTGLLDFATAIDLLIIRFCEK